MVTKSTIDLDQALLTFTAMFQILIPRFAKGIQERLDLGEAPEAVLEEMVEAWKANAESPPEQRGLAYFFKAFLYLKKGQPSDALEACHKLHETLPELDFFSLYLEGQILLLLLRYDEASDAFQKSVHHLQPLGPLAQDMKQDIYQRWAFVGIVQGLEGLLYEDIRAFEKGGLKYVDILEKAQEDNRDHVVEDALAQFKAALKKKKELKAFEELEVFINLMKIKDPFEGWRAIGKEVSKRWPKGHSVKQAVREMRRRS